MPAAPPGEQNQHGSLDLIWVVAAIGIGILALWFFARGPIVLGILHYKLLQLKLLGLFTPAEVSIQNAIEYYLPTPRDVTLSQIGYWLTEIGRYYRYPIALILLICAGFLFVRHPGLKYKNTFDMKKLRGLEKENWPQIAPVDDLNLVTEDIDAGPWAMSPTPMQFAKQLGLLEEVPPDPNAPLTKAELKKTINIRLNHEKAAKVLIQQIGPPWQGIEKAPLHAQALFAIFAARANQDRVSAAKLMKQIALSSLSGKLDFSGVDSVLKKNYKDASVEVTQNHAYLYTVMASMLELARTDGVFSSSDFIWLKPIDRPLWYMLNCVGRRTAFAEISGAFSHWLAEKAMSRRLTHPMVDGAITALEEAIKQIIYTPDK